MCLLRLLLCLLRLLRLLLLRSLLLLLLLLLLKLHLLLNGHGHCRRLLRRLLLHRIKLALTGL